MRTAYRWLAVAYAFAFFSFHAHAQPELFPRPAELEPAVNFWTRVYTEIDTSEGFIHDDLRLNIVYQTVHTGDLGTRERRKRIERAQETTRNILAKLATGARTGLNGEEERILKLFPEGTSNAEFRAATERVRFQLGQADRFRAGLVRSGTYKPYIHEVLAKRGLPPELASLPHVESSFDPTAYSKVGAAGLWQFTRSTGVRYMRIDHIIDERRDPFFATDAAARLLEDNFSVIQSWPLALTAYNHGLAGMRRAVEVHKTSDISTIVAKYQGRTFGFASRNFYAAFLAALAIDQNPERYFSNLKLDPPESSQTISVPAFMTVDTLADALNVRESTLRNLNPALTDIVWSGDKYVPQGFELRVPRETAAVAEALLGTIDASKLFAEQRADREQGPTRRHAVENRRAVPRESRGVDALQRNDEQVGAARGSNRPVADKRRDGAARRDARASRSACRPGRSRRGRSHSRPGRHERRRRLRSASRRQHRAHRDSARRRHAGAHRCERNSQPQRHPGGPTADHSDGAGRRRRRRRPDHPTFAHWRSAGRRRGERVAGRHRGRASRVRRRDGRAHSGRAQERRARSG